jgi:tetratricopeptide (TPR) repeat protein
MARKKRKVGAGGKPPRKEPTTYEGWLKRGRWILTECQLSDRFERDYVAIGIEALDRAIALLPNHPAAWYWKGSLLVQAGAGRDPRARAALMRSVTIDPRNARAWMMLGACESQRGDYVAAREYLEKALALDPELHHYAPDYYDIPDDLREAFFSSERTPELASELAGRSQRQSGPHSTDTPAH